MKRRSLAEERPDLLSSWSPDNEISPGLVTCGSHKKVLWRCEKGHEWAATVKNRALIGSGCPYCSCRAVLKGYNDLATIHPGLTEEWSDKNSPLTPAEVAEFSNKKVWWRCKNGHEWKSVISDRSAGHGCPFCAGQRVWEGFNDLKSTNPGITEEWSEKNASLLPTAVTAMSTLNVWWHCKTCGNDYKAVICSRAKGLRCPHCVSKEAEEARKERQILKSIEKDYKYYLPQIATIYYAGQKGMRVITDDEELVGLHLTAYVPEIRLVIDICRYDKQVRFKEYLLKKKEITYVRVPTDLENEEIIKNIRQAFVDHHIYFNLSQNEDVKNIRERYLIWARNRRSF